VQSPDETRPPFSSTIPKRPADFADLHHPASLILQGLQDIAVVSARLIEKFF
jgi:hypothetical protein